MLCAVQAARLPARLQTDRRNAAGWEQHLWAPLASPQGSDLHVAVMEEAPPAPRCPIPAPSHPKLILHAQRKAADRAIAGPSHQEEFQLSWRSLSIPRAPPRRRAVLQLSALSPPRGTDIFSGKGPERERGKQSEENRRVEMGLGGEEKPGVIAQRRAGGASAARCPALLPEVTRNGRIRTEPPMSAGAEDEDGDDRSPVRAAAPRDTTSPKANPATLAGPQPQRRVRTRPPWRCGQKLAWRWGNGSRGWGRQGAGAPSCGAFLLRAAPNSGFNSAVPTRPWHHPCCSPQSLCSVT